MSAPTAVELFATWRAANDRHLRLEAQWPKVRLATWIAAGVAISWNLCGLPVVASVTLTVAALIGSVVHVERTRSAFKAATRAQDELAERGFEITVGAP